MGCPKYLHPQRAGLFRIQCHANRSPSSEQSLPSRVGGPRLRTMPPGSVNRARFLPRSSHQSAISAMDSFLRRPSLIFPQSQLQPVAGRPRRPRPGPVPRAVLGMLRPDYFATVPAPSHFSWYLICPRDRVAPGLGHHLTSLSDSYRVYKYRSSGGKGGGWKDLRVRACLATRENLRPATTVAIEMTGARYRRWMARLL